MPLPDVSGPTVNLADTANATSAHEGLSSRRPSLRVGPFDVIAYAARRPRLTLDALDERELRFATEGDFLRFGRNCTGGLGTGYSGARGGDSGCSSGGVAGCSSCGVAGCSSCGIAGCSSCGIAGGTVMLRGSGAPFRRPKPKASLNIAPYQSTTASAACNHGCCNRDDMTSAEGLLA